MRISINKGCFNTTFTVMEKGKRNRHLSTDAKKFAISKMIDNISSDKDLESIIEYLSQYLNSKCIYAEYNDCEECADKNTYEEYQL